MTSRCRRRRGPEASRSHTPPPKSAPPNRTYAFSENPRTAARTSESRTSTTGHLRWRVDPRPLCRLGATDDLAVEQPCYDDTKEAVEKCKDQEWHQEPRHRCHRVGCSKEAIDDPWLPSHFGHCPSGLDRDETHWRAHSD